MKRPEPLNYDEAVRVYDNLVAPSEATITQAGLLIALSRISVQLDYMAQLLEAIERNR
jgi:hypothetical protein